MAKNIKTSLYLPELLHRRLKASAAQMNTTVSALLAEGADYIVSRYEGGAQRTELVSRAAEARRRLREGIYSGVAVSGKADELAYGTRERSGGSSRKRRRPAAGR